MFSAAMTLFCLAFSLMLIGFIILLIIMVRKQIELNSFVYPRLQITTREEVNE